MNPEPKDTLKEELSRLIGYACDGVVSEEQRVRLNELLAQGPAMRSHYLRYVAIHSALTTTAGNQATRGVEELRDRLALVGATPAREELAEPSWPLINSSLLRAAVILFLLVPPAYFAVQWMSSVDDADQERLVHVKADGQLTEPQVAALNTEALAVMGQSRARVSRVSAETRWPHPNESYTIDSIIRSGSRLRFLEGEIELVYETGVKLLLIGPVDFILQDGGGELRRGGLMASVPPAAQGFTIETPNGKVVDLGTEFGVMVDDFGVSEVSVFEGKVEAFPASNNSPRDGRIRLTKGNALQWSSDMLKSLEADPRRIPITLASYTQPNFDQGSAVNSLSEEFRGPMSLLDWAILGDISFSEEGLVLKADPTSDQIPYLVSKQQYDPTQGSVTVICDVRFPELLPLDLPSFSILTRSAADRTNMERPWRDVLSTCVRCNFRSASDEIDGLLETSTKYERDRELTSLSWRGFRRPQQGVPYRLVMRDDGVNVSFTVSQIDKPSVTKTVVCRSLFQGYENHIALEGWNRGTVVVDKLQIYQEKSDNRLADHLTRFGLASHEDSRPITTAVKNTLRKNVPSGARLVVDDHFDGQALDEKLWSVLGDVNIENGAVSLGEPNVDDHIDTFHPRPYLLTRREFVPADAELFVLGKIDFDDNFLQGYGGSFAVMTRCGDQYGEGPEWAISALSTGIRCNLWPAAPQADHNLEIHEKLTANTLSFLKGSSLRVDPRSRSYYFLMQDTGDTASITFQDADQPSVVRSIQHETSTDAPRGGYVGFESCWGSRVLLDDVQIYVLESAGEN